MLSFRLVSKTAKSAPLTIFRSLQTSPIVWSSTTEKPKETKNAGQSRKALSKEFGPKRPLSAFFSYCAEHRANYIAQNPEAPTTVIASKLGEAWRSLSDYEKQPYIEQYQKAREKYLEEKAEFEKSLPPKKPLVPFFLFAEEVRMQLKDEQPDLSFGEMASLIGERWKALSNEEKNHYKQKFQENKEKWLQEKEQKLQNFKL
ncbi:DNA binding [Nakaseomyces bracarensis]|uniref:DNA binding n=1 Tax=Nakaseomyces bracarensis TaxID=273131 RepID=A0ABR4NN03_9SACH